METENKALAGLDRALDVAGGTTALTRALGLTKSVVGQWRRAGGIPAGRVPEVSRVTGLSPQTLRPDLFGASAAKGLAEAQAPFESEARALGLDAAAIAARAVREAVGAERARRWAEENRAAIEAHNRYIEEHGLPLAKHRMF